MFTRKGEQQAEPGTYWDISTGQRVELTDQGVLPGNPSKTYIKAPIAVVLLLGPALGLIYAIFLPFIGIAMVLIFAGKKVARLGKTVIGGMASTAAKSMSFGWRPLRAYLATRRQGRNEKSKRR